MSSLEVVFQASPMAASHRVQLLKKGAGADTYNAVDDPVSVPLPEDFHEFAGLERGVYKVSVTGAGWGLGVGARLSMHTVQPLDARSAPRHEHQLRCALRPKSSWQ